MKILKSLRKAGTICIICSFVLGSVFTFAPNSVNASSLGNSTLLAKKSSNNNKKSNSSKPDKKPDTKKSSSSSSKKTTSTKKSSSSSNNKNDGGRKSNNSYAKKSLSGDCKKINGKCTVFSKSGCGNFYIGGRHYGGSKACRILRKNCPSNPPQAGGNTTGTTGRVTSGRTSTTRTATTTTSATASELTRDCTPGVSCPADDLGGIIEQALVTPAYAGQNNKSCPLFWVTGREDADSKIKCTLDVGAGRAIVDVPNDPIANGYEKGYPLPIGKYTLVCVRTTGYDENEIEVDEDGVETILSTTRKTDVEKMEKVLECKQNPAFREF